MQRLSINGTAIDCERYGQGEPLLLLHGAGVSGASWEPQIKTLADRFNLIVPDIRGHGGSAQHAEPYSIPQFADDMIALLDALGIEGALVCGHSMGGAVAQQMAARYPTRVKALIIAESNFGFDNPFMQAMMSFSGWLSRMIGIKRLASMTARQLANRSPQAVPVIEAGFAPHIANPENFWNVYQANSQYSGRAELSRIQCPTLVLIAQNNRATHGYGRTMVQLIPGARLEIIPNAGHLLNWDNTPAFNQAVLRFFDEVK
ncbi:MAG: alpha/beta fold hydrolase [Anaerolineae bacterium]|nr:alpha/beta fold hydrolase [Anaerolineae bacterium]